MYESLSLRYLTKEFKSGVGFPSSMDSMIRKELERFDKTKPILKCSNCGLWRNLAKSDKILFEKLGRYTCMQCGKLINMII